MIDYQDILAVLPQTQCKRCGYDDCSAYAQAVAARKAPINQCPTGGREGISRLSAVTGQPVLPLNTDFGDEQERSVVWIDENWCIGCTRCVKVCPVDAIVGSNKVMHTVAEEICTGCELCVEECPVDCMYVQIVTPDKTGWDAWSLELAAQSRRRYEQHQQRDILRQKQQLTTKKPSLAQLLQARKSKL